MKKTRVLFVIPPLIPLDHLLSHDPSQQWATNSSVPIGVLSIAAYTTEAMSTTKCATPKRAAAKRTGVDFSVLDLNLALGDHMKSSSTVEWKPFLDSCMRKAAGERSIDIVGISAIFNSNAGYLSSIANTAKQLWPDVHVVTGGGLPTNLSSVVFDMAPSIDAIAVGEGEKPFRGLVQAEDRAAYLGQAAGWITKKRLSAGEVPVMDLVENLDDIPYLRYDLVDYTRYQECNRYHGDKSTDMVTASIMTSRGCPYRCNFCSSHTVHGRKVRYHSPDRVLEEIRWLKETYGVNVLLIEDDLFLSRRKSALKILEGLAEEDMTIEFPNGLALMHLDEEMICALKSAGLKMATLAVESGTERVLREIIHKPYRNLEMVRNVVGRLRDQDLYIRAFFIIGFPGETQEEILKSVQFMKDTGFNWVCIMIASPIAGSELYAACLDNGLLISDRLEDFHYGKCNIRLPHSTPAEIEKRRYMINLEVNFIENFDIKHGRPDLALTGFNDVINRVPGHAFAHYCAALCYREMGRDEEGAQSLARYFEIVSSSPYWAGYAQRFDLPLDPE